MTSLILKTLTHVWPEVKTKIVELDYDTPFTHAITVAIQQSPLGNIINFCCRERPSLKSHCLNFAYQFDLL